MFIDFNVPLTDIENDGPLLDDDGKEMDLKTIAVRSLLFVYPDEPNLKPEEKDDRGRLARRIRVSKEPVSLTVEEIALVKKLIGRAFGPKVVTPAFELLDPQAPGDQKIPS